MTQAARIINFPPRHLEREGEQDVSRVDNSFMDRFRARSGDFSPFCLGLDPSDKVLGDKSLAKLIDKCADWTEKIIEEGVAIVKPQSAYFERFGSKGIKELETLTKKLRREGILVLLDAKCGDIGATNEAYAAAYFGAGSPLEVDALTASAYLGFADLSPFFSYEAKYVFVVAASSNPAGAAAPHQQGASLAALLANIGAEARVGAVMGATRDDLTAEMVAPLADSLLLCPGIGAQGAGFESVAKFPQPGNVIPTASRSVLEAADFTESLKRHKELASKHLG